MNINTLSVNAGRPHICFVAPKIWPVLAGDRTLSIVGGAEMRQSVLIRALTKAGYEVSVVTMDFGQPNPAAVCGATVFAAHSPNSGLPGLRFFHPRLTSWWAAMRHIDADIYLQSTAAHHAMIVGLFCRVHQRAFIYSGAHDLDFKRDETWKLFQRRAGWRDRKLFELGLRLADGVVAQHLGQVEACRRWYGREAFEIANCYAPPMGACAAQAGMVLWVATVKSWKRPELFLELARRLPQLRFRMVGGPGPGTEAEVYLQTQIAAAALPNVEFVGFVPFVDVEAHFDAARLFINTSDYEGFPNTFLQAWARAIPTVSFFDCGAQEGGKPIGFVCKNMDEMATAVTRLCMDDAFWLEEGRRAKSYFHQFHSVEMAVAKYSLLFEQVRAKTEG